MIDDMSSLWIGLGAVVSILLTSFRVSSAACYTDSSEIDPCPEGWVGHGQQCYKFVNFPRSNRDDASKTCRSYYSTLVRIGDMDQQNFFNGYLENNVVNKSYHWYTSGIMDPNNFGQYIWESHGPSEKVFSTELNSLWHMTLPKPEQASTWPKDQIYITYGTNGRSYGFYLETGTQLLPFICEIKKADITKVGISTRTYRYGVNNLTDIPHAPCFTEEPLNFLFFLKDTTVQTGDFKDRIMPGENIATYACDAVGNPRPTYQWFIVDTTVKPATRELINPLDTKYGGRFSITEGTLVINFPTVSDPTGEKRYQCEASNKYGTILSDQASLSFGQMSRFSNTPRTPKTVDINKMAALSCDPPAKMKPKKQMVFTFLKLVNNVQQPIRPKEKPMVFPSQSGVLYFSAATMEDNGTYVCIVSMKSAAGGSAQTSPKMVLIVRSAVPVNQETKIHQGFPMVLPSDPFRDETVRLECFADGHARTEIFYKWRKKNGEISTRARFEENNRAIVIEKAQSEDEGEYICTATQEQSAGAKGGTSEKSVTLTLNAVPYFINAPIDQYVDLGKNAVLTCEAGGNPAVTYVWYKGRTSLINGGKLAIETNPGYSQLTISNVQFEDAGTYGCEISNTYGASSAYAWVKVLSFAANFDKFPLENKEGMISQQLIYHCKAEGAPTPTKKWFKDGAPLTTAEVTVDPNLGTVVCSSKYCIFQNGNLMIAKLTATDSGNYTCEAKNSLGSATSTGNLMVMPAPTWTLQPENRQILINTTVDIPCLAESPAHLDINYKWKFESTEIKFDRLDLDSRRYEKSQLLRPYGRNFGSLRIENVQFENEGRYECILNTPIGQEMKDAWIRVAGPPGPCAGVKAETVNSSTTEVSWTPGSSHHAKIFEYRIETAVVRQPFNWSQSLKFQELEDVATNNDERRTAFVHGLGANTTYVVRVRAVNQFGVGEASPNSNEFTTSAEAPVKVPQNVTGGGGRRQTLVVRWNPVPVEFYNGPDFQYIIEYKKPEALKWISKTEYPKNIQVVQKKYYQYTFTLPQGSADYSLYDVRVGSKNKMGNGPFSNATKVYSSEAVPTSTPNDVVAAAFNSTAMIVRWNRPVPTPEEGKIQGYRIVYWVKETRCDSTNRGRMSSIGMRQTVFGNFDEGYIIGLDMDTYYCIVVQMFNQAGDGPESGVTEQTTWKTAPTLFPTLVKLSPTGRSNEIKVSWVGIYTLPQEESLDGYRIRYWLTGAPTNRFKEVDVGMSTHGYLESLAMHTRYDVRVYGYSRGGIGEMSSPMIQFMLEPASTCTPGIYDQPGIRYVFICSGCQLRISFVFTLFCVISTVILRILQ